MKAVYVTHFAPDNNLQYVEDAEKPQPKPGSHEVLIRVRACALNPADCRLMSGSVSMIMKPKVFPYIPGLDVCGIIETVGSKCTSFEPGDCVLAVLPAFVIGGLAEFIVCDEKQVTLAPPSNIMNSVEAASIVTAGCTAMQAVEDARIQQGTKVIVLGASGGVGSLVVQMAKHAGASFIAATSTNIELVQSLGADQVIDYRVHQWWDVVAHKDLDVVIDCVGCDESWHHCDHALSSSGRYVAVVDSPDTQVRSLVDLLGFLGRIFIARTWNPFTRTYRLVNCFPSGKEVQQLVQLVQDGGFRAVLDDYSPVPFHLSAVEEALRIQRSHRAKGKLVVQVTE
ncbi:hypothetical protein Poli38472_007195 [Pythium oligandrum]|uniref:Enoyl reductase (ER) domain-containing protein n=1 Tax=Pythium oligandrum TaxID=41045 RepID=A0A8K1C9M9_PYTOL|nr:hypothetical protein Poli38472_007195 [Pythium oligandrum]|eukprot:TMW59050.1 hypothetical protein Poli38472_007195 [Pythium oligandrum]